jgi:hypothetical protein
MRGYWKPTTSATPAPFGPLKGQRLSFGVGAVGELGELGDLEDPAKR